MPGFNALRGRNAGNEAAAADGNHQRVQFRRILQHFETDRAACHDHRIIEGVDEGQPFLASISRALANASTRSPCSTTCAPCPSVWVTLIIGVETGATIVTGCPAAGRDRQPPA